MYIVAFSDCCQQSKEGEESFKGVQEFNTTLVSITVTNNCTYSQSKSKRQCVGNMKDGPQWSEIDHQNCSAKSPATNSLIQLSKITLCDDSLSEDCQTPVELSGNLSQIINNSETVTTRQDLDYINIVLQSLVAYPKSFLPTDPESAKTVSINRTRFYITILIPVGIQTL